MKRGFTMIELIFVIVIIGILAVIAIPKLNATRDDAKIVTDLRNLSTCISDAGSSFTATGVENIDTTACKNLKCFKVDTDNNKDGRIAIVTKGSDEKLQYCNDTKNGAWIRAQKEHIIRNGGEDETSYIFFGGSNIKM